jgi:hypothetical protein
MIAHDAPAHPAGLLGTLLHKTSGCPELCYCRRGCSVLGSGSGRLVLGLSASTGLVARSHRASSPSAATWTAAWARIVNCET